MKNYVSNMFWGTRDHSAFIAGLQKSCDNIDPFGIFLGDNLFTYRRNLSFLDDTAFMKAVEANVSDEKERAIIWRTFVLLWAARNGLRRQGDFVECGTFKGTTAKILCDALEFGSLDKEFHLYDVFDPPQELQDIRVPDHGPHLYELVLERFAGYPNVHVHKGMVPQVFTEQGAPERISFLHIDMNNELSEIAALETLFDRVVDGGLIIFDDYGWLGNRPQKLAEDDFLAARGLSILELPTGQGLCLK